MARPRKPLLGFLFVTTLLYFGYNLYVFSSIQPLDNYFEINTHFKKTDLYNWFAPQRTQQLISRWRENRTTNLPHKTVHPEVLNECLLSETPCVEMLEDIAPARSFWKTGADILSEKNEVREELAKELSKKMKNRAGRQLTSPEELLAALQEEEVLLIKALNELPWYYRICCGTYNLWNYMPLTLFTFFHYSHLIAALPEGIKNFLNKIISWYMEGYYERMQEDAKKEYKKKTWRLFHGIVESRVEKAFKKLRKQADKHSYIHDYSPYYRKLRYDFDLEVKNVYTELERLLERNRALQEIITT